MFIYTIHTHNSNLTLIQLNPDRSHPHSKLLATAHHPFSAPLARGKKIINHSSQNLLWQALVLLPQAPSLTALPSARQQPKEQQLFHHISLS